jgi:hypothetical protein
MVHGGATVFPHAMTVIPQGWVDGHLVPPTDPREDSSGLSKGRGQSTPGGKWNRCAAICTPSGCLGCTVGGPGNAKPGALAAVRSLGRSSLQAC